jgi:hypothetical protein
VAEDLWNFVGHAVRVDELDLIRSIVDEFAGLSRVELACTVCELLGWTRVTGRLKARECRDLLEHLAGAGLVTLPAKRLGRPVGARTTVPMTARGDIQAAVTGTVHDVAPLAIEPVTPPTTGGCSENSSAGIITSGTPCRTAPTCAM